MSKTMKSMLIAASGLAAACTSQAQPASDYDDVFTAVESYLEARRNRTSALQLTEPVWTGRFSDNGALTALNLDRISDMPAISATSKITSIQTYFGDFAIARTDDWQAPNASLLTAFKTSQGWRIATEATTAGCATRAERFSPEIAARDVLVVLDGYYSAVDADNPAPLEQVHHPDWQMKNHESDKIAAEGRTVFAKRLSDDQHDGYANDRQIADVQIIYDCLAFVRIDKPSSLGVTVFTFYRDNNEWVIVDKAWSHSKP